MYQPLILAIWSSDKVTTDNGSGWEAAAEARTAMACLHTPIDIHHR